MTMSRRAFFFPFSLALEYDKKERAERRYFFAAVQKRRGPRVIAAAAVRIHSRGIRGRYDNEANEFLALGK